MTDGRTLYAYVIDGRTVARKKISQYVNFSMRIKKVLLWLVPRQLIDREIKVKNNLQNI